jgi:hypothetical protein
MDESKFHHVEQDEPSSERQISHAFCHMHNEYLNNNIDI